MQTDELSKGTFASQDGKELAVLPSM